METVAAVNHLGENREPPARADYDGSFAAVFDKYYTRLFAFTYSRVRDVDLAKDLVSEVFERAYARGHQVRDQAAYSSWLFIIARNTIAGHYRRRRQEQVCQEKVGDDLRLAGQPPQPDDFALRDEQIGHLMEAVKALPRRDQELISLKFDAELSHQDIARIMGMTPVNVRVSIFRALKRLRATMEAGPATGHARAIASKASTSSSVAEAPGPAPLSRVPGWHSAGAVRTSP